MRDHVQRYRARPLLDRQLHHRVEQHGGAMDKSGEHYSVG